MDHTPYTLGVCYYCGHCCDKTGAICAVCYLLLTGPRTGPHVRAAMETAKAAGVTGFALHRLAERARDYPT